MAQLYLYRLHNYSTPYIYIEYISRLKTVIDIVYWLYIQKQITFPFSKLYLCVCYIFSFIASNELMLRRLKIEHCRGHEEILVILDRFW